MTLPDFLRIMADQLEGKPPVDTPDGPDIVHIIVIRDLDGKPAIWAMREYKRTDIHAFTDLTNEREV